MLTHAPWCGVRGLRHGFLGRADPPGPPWAVGVLEAALAAIATSGSRVADVEAAIGPAIGGCCYEVGPEVRDAFAARTPDVTSAAWERRGPRWHVDLREAVRARLVAAGVGE